VSVSGDARKPLAYGVNILMTEVKKRSSETKRSSESKRAMPGQGAAHRGPGARLPSRFRSHGLARFSPYPQGFGRQV